MTDMIRKPLAYSVTKKGAIVPKQAKAAMNGPDQKKSEVKEKLIPLSDAAIIARIGTLGNTFLVEADRAILARLLTAISNGIKLATVSKK